MSKKKWIVGAIGVVVTLGVVGGAVWGYKAYQSNTREVSVQPVSYINWGYWGDTETSYGMVTNDSAQEIYLADAKNIKEIYVKQGDKVKVGDPLIAYDMAEANITIERKKLDINTSENNLAKEKYRLEWLWTCIPVEWLSEEAQQFSPGYTFDELVEEINTQDRTVRAMDIALRRAKLELKSLEKASSDGIVYAEVDGEVKTLGDINNPPKNGTAFMVVSGDEGLYVSGTVSELSLGDVTVGTVITANSWETGMTFEATITEISDYPVSGNSWGEGNPNVSYYACTAYIEDSTALRNGEYVDLMISTGSGSEGGIFIEKAYVREDDGKPYCMIADEKGRLKKQYVVTGRTVYGSAVEIKSGLTEEDLIAFPYGKDVVEGALTTQESNMYY